MKIENIIMAIVVGAAALFFLTLLSFGMFSYNNHGYGMMGMMSGFGYSPFMWLFGFLFMVLILVTLVLLILWLVKQLQENKHRKR